MKTFVFSQGENKKVKQLFTTNISLIQTKSKEFKIIVYKCV